MNEYGITQEMKLSPSWMELLNSEFEETYYKSLLRYLDKESKSNVIYPPLSDIFHIFNLIDLKDVKVVILGQDPYHGENQANGMSFSVKKGVKIPPSLKNIFKEVSADLNIETPIHGDLSSWAMQGVFLLNATLTVRKGSPNSHQNKGWENFTDKVISLLSEKKDNLVFLLWGNFAQKKSELIDSKKHLILKAPHPSPFSAHKGFFGCKHFSKANEYLIKNNVNPINWKID